MNSIIHIDGDNFFVSCELLSRPYLKGKAVITGGERGIASAMNREAKAIGITRGMPVFKIKKDFPSVVILPSNFGLYKEYNRRMLDIARRYSDIVLDYSIDECFVDISNISTTLEQKIEIANKLKQDLKNELGLTFSLGLAPTKVLAKVASKNKKPDGFTVITPENINHFLKDLEIQDVWGIGKKMSEKFVSFGITKALQFIQKDEDWVKRHFSIPYQTLWHELRGISLIKLEIIQELPKSIQSTRTFPKNSNDMDCVFSYLSRNIEIACARLRNMGLFTKKVSIFVKDQNLEKYWADIELSVYTNYSNLIENEIKISYENLFNKNKSYRTAGITCHNLIKKSTMSGTLFSNPFIRDDIYNAVDHINKRFGDNSLIFASSMNAVKSFQRDKSKIIIREKLFCLPYLGEVC